MTPYCAILSLVHHFSSLLIVLLIVLLIALAPPWCSSRHSALLNTQPLIQLPCWSVQGWSLKTSMSFPISSSSLAPFLQLLQLTRHMLFPEAAPSAVNGLLPVLPPTIISLLLTLFLIFHFKSHFAVVFSSKKPSMTSPNIPGSPNLSVRASAVPPLWEFRNLSLSRW